MVISVAAEFKVEPFSNVLQSNSFKKKHFLCTNNRGVATASLSLPLQLPAPLPLPLPSASATVSALLRLTLPRVLARRWCSKEQEQVEVEELAEQVEVQGNLHG